MAEHKATAFALKLLSMRNHSRQELLNKFLAKKFDPGEIQSVMDFLENKNLINDAAFVRTYVEELRRKGLGDMRISFELKRKGLKAGTIEENFERESREAQEERARDIAIMKFGDATSPSGIQDKKKVYDYLVRRGFEYEIARDTVYEHDHN